jgi:hypothetical protein
VLNLVLSGLHILWPISSLCWASRTHLLTDTPTDPMGSDAKEFWRLLGGMPLRLSTAAPQPYTPAIFRYRLHYVFRLHIYLPLYCNIYCNIC